MTSCVGRAERVDGLNGSRVRIGPTLAALGRVTRVRRTAPHQAGPPRENGIMHDEKLAADENRRIAQHEAVKTTVEDDVNARVAADAAQPRRGERQVINEVADDMRGRALRETVQTEREIDRARGAARGSQVVDYLFYVVYTLLVARFVLVLLDANRANGFVQFVNAVSDPFYAPFRDIVRDPSSNGFTFSFSILLAIAAYMVLHAGVNGLLRLVAHRKTSV